MKHLPWATAALLASLAAPAAEPPAHPFDGNWNTVLSCENARGALGYSFEFVSVVKDDVLHGEKGSKGEPGWLTLDGKLAADGAATLYASGLVGAAPYAVGDRPAGTAYGYHVEARFAGDSGTGHRVEGRPCQVSFTRRR
ncbi:MAG TPA: hypothetical protein VL994_03815 [Steroidobacteraceae bacterium]|nr:hypothetical protein [Steroidobacteraceae bacterium]